MATSRRSSAVLLLRQYYTTYCSQVAKRNRLGLPITATEARTFSTHSYTCTSSLKPRPQLTRTSWMDWYSTKSNSRYFTSGTDPATVKDERTVVMDSSKNFVRVHFEDGEEDAYPYVWLRDNCQCPQCFDSSAQQRLLLVRNLDVDIKPDVVKMIDEDKFVILWKGGHESIFDMKWLRVRGFSENAQKERKAWYFGQRTYWGSDHDISRAKYINILEDDQEMFNWISALDRYGIFVITNTPCKVGQLRKLGEKVAYLRRTNYGEEFTVKVKSDPSNVAYTGASLGLHLDLIYYAYVPGIQMLHCIQQTQMEGGSNQFADGFKAADYMRKHYPDQFKILSETPIDIHDIGLDAYKFHKLQYIPVIQLSRDGEIVRINYNNQARDTFLNVCRDKVYTLYKAMKQYEDILYDPSNVLKLKLKAGDIACFDNTRVLHGREGFTVVPGSREGRHLEGAYIDWDELYSKMRTIKAHLNL